MESSWAAIRAEFPALAGWTYLNSATYGQTPRCATAAIAEHLARRDRFACQDFMQWFDDMDQVRGLVGRLVHCQADDVAFFPNASTPLSLLLGGLHWRAGDRIVTLEHEFPNHFYYPARLGAVGVEFCETPWAQFYDALTPTTRVVAISDVNYSTGFRAPLEEIAPELKRRGILLYVDATQSLGALGCDVERIRPDMLAADAYKWLLTPNGAGFAYVSPELRALLEPGVIGWRSHKDWRNAEQLHHGAPEFSPTAERYEGGMLPFAPLYAMGAVIALMLEIGVERIERRVLDLAAGVRAALRRQGWTAPESGSQVVCGAKPGVDASAVVRRLKERRVIVAARQGNLRVSPHFYNDESDLQTFEEALRDEAR